MITDARHLSLVTGGSDSERSDTYGITMGQHYASTEELVNEYEALRSFVIRHRSFPTMAAREAMRDMRTRAVQIHRILKARNVNVS